MDTFDQKLLDKLMSTTHWQSGDIYSTFGFVKAFIVDDIQVARLRIFEMTPAQDELNCIFDSVNQQTSEKINKREMPLYFKALSEGVPVCIDMQGQDYLVQEIKREITTGESEQACHLPMWGENTLFAVLVLDFDTPISPLVHHALKLIITLLVQAKQRADCIFYRREIQQLKSMETKLRHQVVEGEKFAALGSLVASVTHEVNTPLGLSITSVSNLIDELTTLDNKFKTGALDQESFEDFVDIGKESCDVIQNNLSRAAKIIKDFKSTAVDQSSNDKIKFDLKKAVTSLVSSVTPELNKRQIKVNVSVPEGVEMQSFPGYLSQVITNLLINSITHAFDNTPHPEITIEATVKDNQVLFNYADNGCGISDDIQDNVFDAYFTTKRESGGSGLGMAIIRDLVKDKLQGSIEIDENYREGARFMITFAKVIKTMC